MIRLFLYIIISLALAKVNVFSQTIKEQNKNVSIKSDSSYYFPLELFPKLKFVTKFEDSTTVLVCTTTYETSDNGIDSIKTYAKVIPYEFDTFRVKWYSEQLLALKEPILYKENSDTEVYRFTWLRTFDHPIAIRIEKFNNNYSINWKVCNGAGGYAPGKLITDKGKAITKQDWDKFLNLLIEIDYWNLNNINSMPGLDGSQWILEGKTKNKYNVVDDWSPGEKSKYFKCCDFLIELTGMKIKNSEKY